MTHLDESSNSSVNQVAEKTPLHLPRVVLLLYDLHCGFGDGEKEVKESRERFWHRIFEFKEQSNQPEKRFNRSRNKEKELSKKSNLTQDRDPLEILGEPEKFSSTCVSLLTRISLENRGKLFGRVSLVDIPVSFQENNQGAVVPIEKNNIDFEGNKVRLLNYDGFYSPFKLGDTYALLVDNAGCNQSQYRDNSQAYLQESLKKIWQQVIERPFQQEKLGTGNIGQSWLIWGCLKPDQEAKDVNFEGLAKAWYEAIKQAAEQDQVPSDLPATDWEQDFKGKGTLWNAQLFECEQLYDDIPDGINRNFHVILCLFSGAEKRENIINDFIPIFYEEFLRLFQYRNKILWAYEQSRKCKNELLNDSRESQLIDASLSNHIGRSHHNLMELQKMLAKALTVSNAHEKHLSILRVQETTIRTNLNNYKVLVSKLVDKTSPLVLKGEQGEHKNDLAFFKHFEEITEQNYLPQIEADIKSFSNAFQPIQNTIKALEGIIGIEKTNNDKSFNQTVATASAGIGAAGLTIQVLTSQKAEIAQIISGKTTAPAEGTPATIQTISATAAIMLAPPLIIGIIFAVITRWIYRRLN